MKVTTNGIIIKLEPEEVSEFCNIIAFALDYHAEQKAKDKNCMTHFELELARELVDITKRVM